MIWGAINSLGEWGVLLVIAIPFIWLIGMGMVGELLGDLHECIPGICFCLAVAPFVVGGVYYVAALSVHILGQIQAEGWPIVFSLILPATWGGFMLSEVFRRDESQP